MLTILLPLKYRIRGILLTTNQSFTAAAAEIAEASAMSGGFSWETSSPVPSVTIRRLKSSVSARGVVAPHTSGLAPSFRPAARGRVDSFETESSKQTIIPAACLGEMKLKCFPLSDCGAVYLFPLIIIKHESEPGLGNTWQQWSTLFSWCI